MGALLIRVPVQVVVQVSLRADLRLREGLVVVVMGGLPKVRVTTTSSCPVCKLECAAAGDGSLLSAGGPTLVGFAKTAVTAGTQARVSVTTRGAVSGFTGIRTGGCWVLVLHSNRLSTRIGC